MSDGLISKQGALKALSWDTEAYMAINMMPTVEAVPVVRCNDCKHRPERTEGAEYYEDLVFPDEVCPCQCDDYFYSWMPDGDWFCKNGERKEV